MQPPRPAAPGGRGGRWRGRPGLVVEGVRLTFEGVLQARRRLPLLPPPLAGAWGHPQCPLPLARARGHPQCPFPRGAVTGSCSGQGSGRGGLSRRPREKRWRQGGAARGGERAGQPLGGQRLAAPAAGRAPGPAARARRASPSGFAAAPLTRTSTERPWTQRGRPGTASRARGPAPAPALPEAPPPQSCAWCCASRAHLLSSRGEGGPKGKLVSLRGEKCLWRGLWQGRSALLWGACCFLLLLLTAVSFQAGLADLTRVWALLRSCAPMCCRSDGQKAVALKR